MAKLARIPAAFRLLIQPMRLRSVRHSPRAFGALTVSEVDDEILQGLHEAFRHRRRCPA